MNPTDRRYTREHEWVLVEGDSKSGLVGLTQFAQEHLGDIVFLELPSPGTDVSQFQKLGEVESVKAVSEIFAPVSGRVLEVNQAVSEHPELINQDPYGQGWLLKVAMKDASELGKLLTAKEYDAFLTQQA